AEDGIRDDLVTGVQTCALPISSSKVLMWRSTSNSIAFCMKRTEFKFLSSTLVPNVLSPLRRTETFASHRRFPFSMSASEAPTHRSEERRVGKEGRSQMTPDADE